MEKLKIKIVNKSKHALPEYSTEYSAGLDLRANINSDVLLKTLERALIPTGLFIELPERFEAQIRPRGGMTLKHGISMLNTPGTIDSDYRGEIGIILVNLSNQDYVVKDGERICQMIINKHEQVSWTPVSELETSQRGDGGFGHTGKK